MENSSSLAAPGGPVRRAVPAGLVIVGTAIVAYVLRRPLLMPRRSTPGGGIAADRHVWLYTFNGVALLTLAALPLAGLTVWALARHRIATGTTSPWAWRKSLAEVGIVYGTVPWVWLIMLPGARAGAVPGRVSLVPLRDLLAVLSAGPATATIQIVGNLLVFAALRLLAPLRFPALASLPRISALAAGCSISVEVAQYVLQLDRVSSVDDVLVNTAGAGLAALASRGWWRP
ncbi:VanZ family protein [Nocardia wallacei]|uniref:VanZ family protein n=1 Tax=Nocardia wallacei TaxID=480035 RepID=UPI00245842AB|nr:VanZ family protein [Nocardia wallacei]